MSPSPASPSTLTGLLDAGHAAQANGIELAEKPLPLGVNLI
jgi:hypothetical protein